MPDPITYTCSTCGAEGVKLWRESLTFTLNHLECGMCLCKELGVCLPDDEGLVLARGGYTDQIGPYVPAVPLDLDNLLDVQVFWGYTSVPQPSVDWWKALPTNKKES